MLYQKLVRFSVVVISFAAVVGLTGCKSDSEFEALSTELKKSKEEVHLLQNSKYELQNQLEKFKNYTPVEVAKARVHRAIWILECNRLGLTNSFFTPCKFELQEVEDAFKVISVPVEFDWPVWFYNARTFWFIIFILYVPLSLVTIILLSLVFRFTSKTLSPAFWYVHSEKFRVSLAVKWSKAKNDQKLEMENLRSKYQIELNQILKQITLSTKKLQESQLAIDDLDSRIEHNELLLNNLERDNQVRLSAIEKLKDTEKSLDSFITNELNRLAKHKIVQLAKEEEDLDLYLRELHKRSKSG